MLVNELPSRMWDGVGLRKAEDPHVFPHPHFHHEVLYQRHPGRQVIKNGALRTSLEVQWVKTPCFHCRGRKLDPWLGN